MTQTMEGKWCLDGSWCSDAGCNGAHFPNSTCSGKSRGSKSPFFTCLWNGVGLVVLVEMDSKSLQDVSDQGEKCLARWTS
jgi:hypothetical protein